MINIFFTDESVKRQITDSISEIFTDSDLESETRYLEVFKVADYETEFRFSKFKMSDPIWWTNVRKGHSIFSIQSMNMYTITTKYYKEAELHTFEFVAVTVQ